MCGQVVCGQVVCGQVVCEKVVCGQVVCGQVVCRQLCVDNLCVDKLCVDKLERRRGGGAEPKTRTPHKDVGNYLESSSTLRIRPNQQHSWPGDLLP